MSEILKMISIMTIIITTVIEIIFVIAVYLPVLFMAPADGRPIKKIILAL